ncbi:hypothetical protein D9M70_564860 [compost metagenome]
MAKKARCCRQLPVRKARNRMFPTDRALPHRDEILEVGARGDSDAPRPPTPVRLRSLKYEVPDRGGRISRRICAERYK